MHVVLFKNSVFVGPQHSWVLLKVHRRIKTAGRLHKMDLKPVGTRVVLVPFTDVRPVWARLDDECTYPVSPHTWSHQHFFRTLEREPRDNNTSCVFLNKIISMGASCSTVDERTIAAMVDAKVATMRTPPPPRPVQTFVPMLQPRTLVPYRQIEYPNSAKHCLQCGHEHLQYNDTEWKAAFPASADRDNPCERFAEMGPQVSAYRAGIYTGVVLGREQRNPSRTLERRSSPHS